MVIILWALSEMPLVLTHVFQIQGSPSPQVGYDLQQFGKLYLCE